MSGAESPREGRESGAAPRAYWRANLRLIAALLAVWALVSFGLGIVLVEPLNRFRLGGFPLGFWFAQQGAIYVFVVLIAVYVVAMDRLDRRHGVDDETRSREAGEPRPEGESSDPPPSEDSGDSGGSGDTR